MKIIAVKHHVAIIVTNLASKFEDNIDFMKLEDLKQDIKESEVRPTLGKYWLHVPNTRLIVSKSSAVECERVLVIKKSDYIKLGNTCTVQVLNSGVR